MTTLFKKFLYNTRWGEWSLVSLYISVLSGIVIGLQYHSDTPLYSSTTLELLIPYGSYFRSLHFYSSQLFFLFSIIHLIAIFEHTESYSQAKWIQYILSLPVVLLLLFTGYVLRDDTTGSSAGIIAENILLSIPLIGDIFNSLLFSVTTMGLSRVYLNHVIGLDLLFLLLLWNHLRRYRIKFSSNLFITSATLLSCLFITAPLEIAKPGVLHITGPWFFVGLQELLKYLPVFIAGIFLPGVLILALFWLRKENKYYLQLLIFIVIWLSIYFIQTLIGFSHS